MVLDALNSSLETDLLSDSHTRNTGTCASAQSPQVLWLSSRSFSPVIPWVANVSFWYWLFNTFQYPHAFLFEPPKENCREEELLRCTPDKWHFHLYTPVHKASESMDFFSRRNCIAKVQFLVSWGANANLHFIFYLQTSPMSISIIKPSKAP